MRWLKHLTGAHDDPAICVILEQMGPEGYGIYWLLLEHIGLSIEKGGDETPSRTHSIVKWSQICHCSARAFRKFVETATELRLIESKTAAELVQFASRTKADRLQIDIPKLLKYRDEYTKKSGQTPAQDRETDRDRETEQKQTEAPPKTAAEKVSVMPPPAAPKASDLFETFWDLYPRKVSPPAAKKAWKAKVLSVRSAEEIISALKERLPSLLAKDQEFRPHPSTWLNQERWKDPIEQAPRNGNGSHSGSNKPHDAMLASNLFARYEK